MRARSGSASHAGGRRSGEAPTGAHVIRTHRAQGASAKIDRGVSSINGQRLTKRERQIVEALFRGCTNKDIARELGISPQTVKNLLSTLFKKLHVRGRLELVVRAMADVEE
jgi:DNA-binding NarL/FixJ family response regulator